MELKLGKYLKDKREQKRLTLRQVEDETGIKNAYLSQLENGKIENPSPKYLHKLSEIYRVPYAMLLELAGYPTVEKEGNVKRFVSKELNTITSDEEEKLVEYLRFLRSTNK
jgi:transcriptional regulator with XRE-family HTH domain